MKSLGLAVLILSPLWVNAASLEPQYLGVALSNIDYRQAGGELEPTTINLKLGQKFSRNLAVEGRLGLGVSDGDGYLAGQAVSVDIEHFLGVYAVGIIPLHRQFGLYGLAGYSHAKISGGLSGKNETTGDFSFGGGAKYIISPQLSADIEYTRLFDDSRQGFDYKVDALTLGVEYRIR